MTIITTEKKELSLKKTFLTGDIGGTNTTFALIGVTEDGYTLLLKEKLYTFTVENFAAPINKVLDKIREEFPSQLYPTGCCLSAAGPVHNNRCTMSNVNTKIDGHVITSETGLPTKVINDFLALSYSLPLLEGADSTFIKQLPHSAGSYSEPVGDARVVIGAGTGLGVGYQIIYKGNTFALPSEGGHYDFPPFDTETRELKQYILNRRSTGSGGSADNPETTPGAELFISGQGISNIYNFYKDTGRLSRDETVDRIDNAEDRDKPAIISEQCSVHSTCRSIMQLFITMYGKFASNIALTFLPTAGLFLAGGIVSKNEALFETDSLFMRFFEMNYKPHIRTILSETPVYIVRDYSVSLFGAAHAAADLL